MKPNLNPDPRPSFATGPAWHGWEHCPNMGRVDRRCKNGVWMTIWRSGSLVCEGITHDCDTPDDARKHAQSLARQRGGWR